MACERQVVDAEKAEVLDAAVRRVLAEAGMWVHHPEMLAALSAKGAVVDDSARRARIGHELVEEVLALRPASGLCPGGAAYSGEYATGMGFEIAPCYYDYDLGGARLATAADLVAMAKLAQMVPEARSVAAAVTVHDMSPVLEPLESFLLVARHTDKPISAVSLVPAHNPYFSELGSLLTGSAAGYIGSGGWMTSPLCISQRAGELARLAPDYSTTSAGAGSMIISGMSGPVTRAGAIVVGMAEILGTWIGEYALQPRLTGFHGSVATGVMDPRNGRGCFGGPEAAIQDIGICELAELQYGGGIGLAGAGYVDGKVPSVQVGVEKVAKCMYYANAWGTAPRIGCPGLLDAGRVFSPVQFLIDLELDRSLWALHRELDVSAEEVAVETILEATAQYGSSFIGIEHTARHYREALWLPQLMDRAVNYPPPDQRLEQQVAERANARWQELVAAWQPVSNPHLGEIEEVVARAKEELTSKPLDTFMA